LEKFESVLVRPATAVSQRDPAPSAKKGVISVRDQDEAKEEVAEDEEGKVESALNTINDKMDEAADFVDGVTEAVEVAVEKVDLVKNVAAELNDTVVAATGHDLEEAVTSGIDFINENFADVSEKVLGPIADLTESFLFLGPVGTAMKLALQTVK